MQIRISEEFSLREEGVQLKFNFPKEVKTACEQYLMYFGQFLQDIGVETLTKISEGVEETVFSVIPTDKSQALNRIREALAIYLNLPTIIDYGSSFGIMESIEIQRMQANVQYMQGQMLLARATIQQQSLTIDQQRTIIEQNIASFNILNTSLKSAKNMTEPLLGNIVLIKALDLKVIQINLPEIYRILKKFFKEDHEV